MVTDMIAPTDNDQFELSPQEIQGLIDDSQARATERRSRTRYPISCAMRLTPIDQATRKLLRYETIEVRGRDISVIGICFSHTERLLGDRAVISFINPKIGRFAVEVKIVWTRRTPLSLYESGCVIIKRAAGHTMGETASPQE